MRNNYQKLALIFLLVPLFSACVSQQQWLGEQSTPVVKKPVAKAPPKKPTVKRKAPTKKAVVKKKKRHKSYSYKVRGKRYTTIANAKGYSKTGTASWYGKPFHGRKTANGEIYNMYSMTAAHKRLPLPTKLRVTNLANKRSVVVRVNDRGPFHGNRIIDLSYAAAKKLGFIHSGVARVKIQVIR